MELSTLSNEEVIARLNELVTRERRLTVKLLTYLAELDERGVYRELGYQSLFEYCTKALKYSEGSACRRITSARALRANPELRLLIEQGKVNLCTLTTAAKSIESKVTSIEEISGRSKREVESLVARTQPAERKPKESVKPVTVKQSELPLFSLPQEQEERVEIRFSLSKEDYQRLEEAKSKLSNALGKDLSVEAVIGKLLDSYLKARKESPKPLSSSDTRYISRALKEAVLKRDGGQCTYTSSDGHRCEAKTFLQIDHIVPFSVGGRTELSNLRVLCSCHNQLMAERFFGKEFIQQFHQ